MANVPLTTFNAGEFTPLIAERLDTDKYKAGCRKMQNLLPRIYGPAEKRPGTLFVADITEDADV